MSEKALKQSIEQRRAKYCLKVVNAHKDRRDIDWQDSYATYTKSLPATVFSCGLGQAMASLLAKDGSRGQKPHGQLYSDIEGWLCGEGEVFPKGDLMAILTASSMEKYMFAQSEALALLVWLKKFATAFLGKAGESIG